jgi:glycosyltransferase involved in cell wall biosynthesis
VDALRRRPDVVLALNVANGPALPLLKARGIPVVMNVDGIEWERGKWGSLARRAFRLGARMSARFADVLVADSMEVGRVWRQEFGVEPVHIPYGADLIEQVPARRVKEAGLVPGEYAIAVARLVPENHVEVFLDALDRLNGAVHGVVVGTANYDNPIESRLRAMAATGRVTWLGHVEDPDLLDELWSHAAVYFHGHSVGGTNPALLQALGNACAVVAVDTPFNREVLGPRATLVPPDPEAVGDRLRQLCVDVDLRAEVAAEGPAIIRERYTWQSVLEAYERLLEDTGSRRRR